MKKEIGITEKQLLFIEAQQSEVLFGGAAGGGKSVAQVLDCAAFAMRYPGSRQLLLRRTLPELEMTLVRLARTMLPAEIYTYASSRHEGTFANGSVADFGYCDSERDVTRYQSAEYDAIRFDELTHFTEYMYLYLMSRLRGANGFPKQLKSTSNPGGVGHVWVKKRFVDAGTAGETFSAENGGSRIFIPSLVDDNLFLMRADPQYKQRLANLPARERKALLHGVWDIADGQFFSEWNPELHVARGFAIPLEWDRYFVMDYGLDMLAGYFVAVDSFSRAYVYRELYQSGLIISRAAQLIAAQGERVLANIAPPDMWNARQDAGKSAADIFAACGVPLVRAGNDRAAGWYSLKELLNPKKLADGTPYSELTVFDCCKNLIRTLPLLQTSRTDPADCERQPHELTHAADALRYFAAFRYGLPAQNVPSDSQLAALLDYGR